MLTGSAGDPQQRAAALAHANAVRQRHAHVVAVVRGNPSAVVSILLAQADHPDPELERLRIDRLLAAIPRVGVVRVDRMLAAADGPRRSPATLGSPAPFLRRLADVVDAHLTGASR